MPHNFSVKCHDCKNDIAICYPTFIEIRQRLSPELKFDLVNASHLMLLSKCFDPEQDRLVYVNSKKNLYHPHCFPEKTKYTNKEQAPLSLYFIYMLHFVWQDSYKAIITFMQGKDSLNGYSGVAQEKFKPVFSYLTAIEPLARGTLSTHQAWTDDSRRTAPPDYSAMMNFEDLSISQIAPESPLKHKATTLLKDVATSPMAASRFVTASAAASPIPPNSAAAASAGTSPMPPRRVATASVGTSPMPAVGPSMVNTATSPAHFPASAAPSPRTPAAQITATTASPPLTLATIRKVRALIFWRATGSEQLVTRRPLPAGTPISTRFRHAGNMSAAQQHMQRLTELLQQALQLLGGNTQTLLQLVSLLQQDSIPFEQIGSLLDQVNQDVSCAISPTVIKQHAHRLLLPVLQRQHTQEERITQLTALVATLEQQLKRLANKTRCDAATQTPSAVRQESAMQTETTKLLQQTRGIQTQQDQKVLALAGLVSRLEAALENLTTQNQKRELEGQIKELQQNLWQYQTRSAEQEREGAAVKMERDTLHATLQELQKANARLHDQIEQQERSTAESLEYTDVNLENSMDNDAEDQYFSPTISWWQKSLFECCHCRPKHDYQLLGAGPKPACFLCQRRTVLLIIVILGVIYGGLYALNYFLVDPFKFD